MKEDIKFSSVDQYIEAHPEHIRKLLQNLRTVIKQTVPEAEEVISYNMPAFRFHGILLYYAAHTGHIGFYPGSVAVNHVFRDQLTGFQTSKGTVRFPFDRDMPIDLIRDIVSFRKKENEEKSILKTKRRTKAGGN